MVNCFPCVVIKLEAAHEWLVGTWSPQAGFMWSEKVERCFLFFFKKIGY